MLFLTGWVASCGALLAVAGASKLYRSARGMTGGTAVLRALRLPRRWWRGAETAAGCAECAAGVAVCAGSRPASLVMAGLGGAFCVLLGYVRARRVPGGCGCIEWRTPARTAATTVSWRAMARSAMVLGAGIAGSTVAGGDAAAFGRAWFDAGVLAGGATAVLLSMRALWRTPVCHRPVWRPGRATLRALTGHGVFQAMAESAGPFGPAVRHRAAGCSDEFWFTRADGHAEDPGVLFQVRYAAPDRVLTVRASLHSPPAGAGATRWRLSRAAAYGQFSERLSAGSPRRSAPRAGTSPPKPASGRTR